LLCISRLSRQKALLSIEWLGTVVFDLLYVEDNPVNVILLSAIISSRSDIRMRCAADGRTALIILEKLSPDLIVLDFRLPDTDGITLLAELKALPNVATIRAVLFTAARFGMKEGFADVWTKPVDTQQVLASLARLLPPGAPNR
jgi:CheY-like chemotaxis protein